MGASNAMLQWEDRRVRTHQILVRKKKVKVMHIFSFKLTTYIYLIQYFNTMLYTFDI